MPRVDDVVTVDGIRLSVGACSLFSSDIALSARSGPGRIVVYALAMSETERLAKLLNEALVYARAREA